jgi:predicted nucleotide-binding protein
LLLDIDHFLDHLFSPAFAAAILEVTAKDGSRKRDRLQVNRLLGEAIACTLELDYFSARKMIRVAQKFVDQQKKPQATHEPRSGRVASRDVFIVHGRDNRTKSDVKRLIKLAGLNPIILHEQVNEGRAIIEKFEAHGSSAGFAVVLLTPDDVGAPKGGKLRPRARQNVIGEMFWFAGKLGRKRVCALMKGDVEIPSDFAGFGYIQMNERGWKDKVLSELSRATLKVDWQKARR